MGQNFNLIVPLANVAMTCGDGPVMGVSTTTADNQFIHAGGEVVIEAASHLRSATTALWSGAGTGGVLMGTPATIQHSAGGGVQIYAGAGITPAIGGPGGPGAPFGASGPAQFQAGSIAEANNRFNDRVKAVGGMVGGAIDFNAANGEGLDAVKGALDVVKGAWEYDQTSSPESRGSTAAQDAQTTAAIGEIENHVLAYETASKLADGDVLGAAVGLSGKLPGQSGNADQLKALGTANAARKAASDLATQAGGPGAPSDGPRIHEVAPANIDREVGVDMTAKVGGKKEDKVDGNIEMTSGDSVSVKAANKIETSSMKFEAHANISAKMVGLATAKMESLGIAAVEGKGRVKIESKAKIAAEAPTIVVKGTATWTLETPKAHIKSPDVTIGAGKVKIDSMTEITKQLKVLGSIVGKKSCHLDESLEVKGGACVHKNLQVKGKIKNGSLTAN